MPLYLCRWPNGDCSIALASNKGAAIETLDELANAEGCSLTILRDFMVHSRLSDSGELEFEGFGEATEEAEFEQAYPVLEETRLNLPYDENGSLTPEGVTMIQEAVAKERQRIRLKNVKEPDTELGRKIKKVTHVPYPKENTRSPPRVKKQTVPRFAPAILLLLTSPTSLPSIEQSSAPVRPFASTFPSRVRRHRKEGIE